MANEHWYVLKVRPGFEMVVVQRLRKLHLEAFVLERERMHSQEPPDQQTHPAGYVYCRFALENRKSLTSIPGVLDILVAAEPTSFDAEISALRPASGSR